MRPTRSRSWFSRFSKATARFTGRPMAFAMAAGVVLAWIISGPIFHFSNTWQLVINTGTTIITFLMVFLIQNTQNRDTAALQLKLDELIRAHEGARNRLLQLEDLTEEEMAHIKRTFLELARSSPLLSEEGEALTARK